MPTLAATVHTSCPAATPAAVRTPPRRPPTIELRMVSAVSGPGVHITTAQTPKKASASVTMPRASHTPIAADDQRPDADRDEPKDRWGAAPRLARPHTVTTCCDTRRCRLSSGNRHEPTLAASG